MAKQAVIAEEDAYPTSPAPAAGQAGSQQKSGAADVGSTYRSGFGEELPAAVYQSILLGFACMLAVAWLAFGGATSTDLDLGVVTVLCLIFLMLPVLMHRLAAARAETRQPDLKGFLSAGFETATGRLPAREAWLQVALIPVALAIAAALIGGVYTWLG